MSAGPPPLTALVSDFGGVLTSPLIGAFAKIQDRHGVPVEALGTAMMRIAQADGAHPLFELECGRITEAAFLARLGEELSADLGREVAMHDFAEVYFEHLETNHEMVAFLRALQERGVRLALLTNNVREWEPHWRAMVPVDEIFELIVDSAFVGMRKPDAEIYELTLHRFGVPGAQCLFLDDIEINVDAARAFGMHGVWFRDTAQAIADIESALRDRR